MKLTAPCHQRACCGTPTVYQGILHRRDDALVRSQAQIIIRAKIDERLAVDFNPVAALRARTCPQRAAQPAAVEIGQGIIEPVKRCGHGTANTKCDSDATRSS